MKIKNQKQSMRDTADLKTILARNLPRLISLAYEMAQKNMAPAPPARVQQALAPAAAPAVQPERDRGRLLLVQTGILEAGLLAGGVAGFLLARLLMAPRTMPHLKVWEQELARSRGDVEAALIAAHVQERYDELYARRPRFDHGALRYHLEKNILPGIALYQVLQPRSRDRQIVLDEMETLFAATFGGPDPRMAALRRLPGAFALFKRAVDLELWQKFPPAGWEIEKIEDSHQTYAFNIHRCFYLNVLAAYGVPELTPLYCKMDDLRFQHLPLSIQWERTGTLGRGDPVCDFRWSHIDLVGELQQAVGR